MKKIVLLLNLLVLFITAFAQSPYGFHYQAVVQNDSMRMLANTAVEVRTSVLTETNYIVFREVQTATTDEFGLLTIEVGNGTVEVGALNAIPWGSEPFFLQSEITPVDGGISPIVITERIMSVPYALYANETEQDFSGNYNDLTNKPVLFSGSYYSLINRPQLKLVATTGSYHDLTDTLTFAPVATSGSYNDLTDTLTFAPVATSGSYNDLTNQPDIPTIPTNVSAFSNDAGYLTSTQFNNLVNTAIQQLDSLTLRAQEGALCCAIPEGDALPCPEAPTVTDADTIVYHTVKIGQQCWMKENLRVKKYADGKTIPLGTEASDNIAYRYYPNNDSSNVIDYGYLYNWAAIMHGASSSTENPSLVQGICPTGWHLPSNAEWTELTDYISGLPVYRCEGNSSQIAKALADTIGWNSHTGNCAVGDNQGANNTTGFGAVPAGRRGTDFNSFGINADMWSATMGGNNTAYSRNLNHQNNFVATDNQPVSYGLSVRCVRGTGYNLAALTTAEVTAVGFSEATAGGNVTYSGNTTVTARGVCWSTSHNPTIADAHTTNDNGLGSFISTLTGLAQGTTYYVRAYATNSMGTRYGDEVSFTTLQQVLPTVTTDNVSNISHTTATCGGNVTDDGSATVTARGLCWGTTANPTINGQHHQLGSGLGSFTYNLTGLTPGSTYHVRAYATNSVGTAYGDDITFTTNALLQPTVTTIAPTQAGNSTATGGGSVTDDGGTTVTARGVCWGTSHNPTVSGSHTTDGNGNGAFTSTLTNLTPGTTYYVRAYATNSMGTAYGEEYPLTMYLIVPKTSSENYTLTSTATVYDHGGPNHNYDNNCFGLLTISASSPNKVIKISGNYNIQNTQDKINIFNGNDITDSTLALLTGSGTLSSPVFSTQGSITIMFTSDGSITQSGFALQVEAIDIVNPSSITISGSHVSCDGNPVQLTASSNVPGTYTWSNGATGSQISVGAGTYTVTITTSSNHKKYSDEFIVTSHNTVYHEFSVTECDEYTWNGTTYTQSGNYTQTFTAATGCDSIVTLHLTIHPSEHHDDYVTINEIELPFTYLDHVFGPGTPAASTMDFTLSTSHGCDSIVTLHLTVNLIPAGDGQTCPEAPSVTDIDGNVYQTVKIGNQCWMKENLRVKHYADNADITLGSSTSQTVPFRYYPNNDSNNVSDYGYLYNWAAIMHGMPSSDLSSDNVQGICPAGWHLPSDAEWGDLMSYITTVDAYSCNGNNNAIAKALAANAEWNTSGNSCVPSINPSLNNSTGFSAMPAGDYYSSAPHDFTKYADFWSSTAANSQQSWVRRISHANSTVSHNSYNMDNGFSVRCVLGNGINLAVVTTDDVTNIAAMTATCGGNVTYAGNTDLTGRGVCWSTNPNPTVSDSHTSDGTSTGHFTSNLTDLTPNTVYYVRAYASNAAGTVYGEQKSFTTSCNTVSIAISGTSSIEFGQSTTLNASGASTYVWSTGQSTSAITVSPATTTTYTVTGTNQYGCTASASKTVTVNFLTPTVITNNYSNVTTTSAICGGNVTADGGSIVTARGVCWSTSHNPTVSDNHTTDGSGIGIFTSNITNLTPNTTYYVRAYATSNAGTGYGEEKTFTTLCNNVNLSITGTTTINYGQSTTLTASGANTYSWSSGQSTAAITVSPATTTTYTVTGTNQYGCTATASRTVTVNFLIPTVSTNNVTNIAQTSASCGGSVTADGGANVTARGVCWSTSHNPTVNTPQHTTNGSGTGSFTSSITGLIPNTTYYVRAYATNSKGTGYGEEKTFTTSCNTMTVSISGNTNINYGESTTLTASGANTYSWSTGETTPTIIVSPTTNTSYYVTGTDLYGCSASAAKTVAVTPVLPTVTTNDLSNVTTNSATCGGNVTSHGGANVTARGVCWSTSHNPTVSDQHTTNSTGTGNFNSSITGLTPNTTYYVRAYATNIKGTAYGAEKTFTTSCENLTVTISGNSTIDYGQSTTLTASGANTYQWSTGATTNSITVSPTSTTTYHVTGTDQYGCTANASKTVTVNFLIPTVSTNNVTNIAQTSASCGGSVTADGGANVTARGVCWSTSPNPTASGSHTTDGTGTGNFNSSITGLTPNTTYYVRAYATNSAGTAYGEEKTFSTPCNTVNLSIAGITTIDHGQSTTLTASGANTYQWSTGANTASITVSPVNTTTYYVTGTNQYGCTATVSKTVTVNHLVPTVITHNAATITTNSAICGGEVTSDGGETVTERGLCWNTTGNPGIGGSHVAVGSGIGSFSHNLTNLNDNTTYYVRAYAINSIGTNYGNEVHFTTTAHVIPTRLDIDGNRIVCENQTTTLKASSDVTGTYQWSNGQSDSIITVGAGTYTVTITTSTNDTMSASVTVTQAPNYNIDTYLAICENELPYTYGNTVIPVGTAAQSTHTLHLSSIYGCDSTVNLHLTILPMPVLTHTPDTIVPASVPVTLWASGASQLIWKDANGNVVGTGNTLTVSPSSTTTYTVTGTVTSTVAQAPVITCETVESITVTTLPAGDALPCPGLATVTDIDDNIYNTVKIGQQCWMKENLRVTRYADEKSIELGTSTSSSTAYRYNPDNDENNVPTYGYLYNWAAVMHGMVSSNSYHVQGICPTGWHVPSDAEWTELTNYLSNHSVYVCGNDNSNITKALSSTTGWWNYNSPCAPGHDQSHNNTSGFNAVAAGHFSGNYGSFGEGPYFWTSTQDNSSTAYSYNWNYSSSSISRAANDKYSSFSVRCLHGSGVNLAVVTTAEVSDISQTTATCGGNVTYNGDTTVTARGICWSTSHNPTINTPQHTSDGAGMGPFTSSLTGLTPSTTYYVRAYATNIAGTVYGEEKTFTTSDNIIPHIVTINGSHTVCGQQTTTLTATSDLEEGTFHWSNGQDGPEITVGVGTYTVTVTSPTGHTKVSTPFTVYVPTLNVEIEMFAPGDQPCNLEAFGIKVKTYSTSYGDSFQWYEEGVLLPNETSEEIYFPNHELGHFTYSVTVTNSEGCTGNGSITFYVVRCIPPGDTEPCPGHETVTDIDGNPYQTVQIGQQCWMKENLRTTHFPDGVEILSGGDVPANSSTLLSETVPYRYIPNGNANILDFGYLYNWPAIMHGMASSNAEPSGVQGICPDGWHLPSDAEWTQLTSYVSSQPAYVCDDNIANIAKSLASIDWWYISGYSCAIGYFTEENDITGFNAIPAGGNGGFRQGFYAWSATASNSNNAIGRDLSYNSPIVADVVRSKNDTRTVRCVLGDGYNFPRVTTHDVGDITPTTATCGGHVHYDGNANLSARGVCWSTSPNPTVSGSHTTNGTGTGPFTSNLTGLTPNTTYYVRAYATNIVGTVYGEEKVFTTSCNSVNVSISGNTTINHGQSTTITASGANTYVWSTGASTAAITVSPTATTSYTVTGTNQYGCTATASTTVTVNTLAPTVTTTFATSSTSSTATCGGDVTSDGGATVTARGVCWSTSHNPTVSGPHTTDGTGTGPFTSNITGLSSNTTYYVRAYATNNKGTSYGEEMSFKTACDNMTVTISGNGTIDYGQSTTLTASGATTYVWSTSATTASITVTPTTTTIYSVTGSNPNGCSASVSKTVTVNFLLPTVTTGNITNITTSTANGGGNVTADGGAAITARGVCWSTSHNPTVSDSHTTDGTGTGSFTSSITGLTFSTTYYVRAYATNSTGTAYGEEKSFTTESGIPAGDTQPCSEAPTVKDIDDNVYQTVKLGNQCWMKGNLRTKRYADGTTILPGSSLSNDVAYYYNPNNNASNVETYGHLYNWAAVMRGMASSNANPSNVQGICPTGWHVPSDAEWKELTDYVSTIPAFGCNGDSTKIAKALASDSGWDGNNGSCAVGNNQSTNNSTKFSALPAGYYGYSVGGFGNDASLWSATISNTNTSYAFGRYLYPNLDTVGVFNHNQNFGRSVRCVLGPGVNLPTVTTSAVSAIDDENPTIATGGGNVTYSGNTSITARGICWSTSQNPTVNGSHTTDGTGEGIFTSSLTGLSLNTTYYVRAYATNSAGTVYGNEVVFTTGNGLPAGDGQACPSATSVTDIDGNSYQTVKIGNQCWMKENLRVTHYADGKSIHAGGTASSTTVSYYYDYTSSGLSLNERGYLYNWAAVMHGITSTSSNVQGICPTGWHVPSDAEWTALTNYVKSKPAYHCSSNSNNIAKALAATSGWNNDNGNCSVGNDVSSNNLTGFSAIPAGYFYGTSCSAKGNSANFWSSTENGTSNALDRNLYNNYSYVNTGNNNKSSGYSVRCIQGDGVNLPEVITTAASGIRTYTSGNTTAYRANLYGNVIYNGNDSVTTRGICYSTSPNPTVSDNIRAQGSGSGTFECWLPSLGYNTTYYARAYATNSAGTVYGNEVTFTTGNGAPSIDARPCQGHETVSDYDGNTYNTVQIGSQCWMKENLKTTHFADGTDIPEGTGPDLNNACRYNPNNNFGNVSTLGYLYNWKAAMHGAASSNATPSGVQGICPTGWHIPSEAEWTNLTDYVKGQSPYQCSNSNNIARALAGNSGWSSSETTCTPGKDQSMNNATGFSALPAGQFNNSNVYELFGASANFWSSTAISGGSTSRYFGISYNNSGLVPVGNTNRMNNCGLSIRCVLDEPNYSQEACPTSISVSATTNWNSVLLTWQVSGGIGSASVIVKRGTTSTTNLTNLTFAPISGTQYCDLDVLPGTTYHYQVMTSTCVGSAVSGQVDVKTKDYAYADGQPCPNVTMVQDYDHNFYHTVKIGAQCWLRENIRSTHYADGTPISLGNNTYNQQTAYRYYPDGQEANVLDYGYLYNWKAALGNASSGSERQGVCPNGWHIPNANEVTQLNQYLQNNPAYWCDYQTSYTAKVLANTTGWTTSTNTCSPGYNMATNNATGFSLLPAGYRLSSSSATGFGSTTYLWTTHETSSQNAEYFGISVNDNALLNTSIAKNSGLSVRCIRDAVAAVGDILCTDGSLVSQHDWPLGGKTAMGVVFQVDETGKHGCAVDLQDNSTSCKWSTSNTNISGISTSSSDTAGYHNTQLIRAAGNATSYPAAWTVDFNNGWYLPAIKQLTNLYAVRTTVNATLTNANGQEIGGGNTTWKYWSSTASNASSAYIMTNTTTTGRSTSAKNSELRVRGVRSF